MNPNISLTKKTNGEFLFYQTEDGKIRLQVNLTDETIWLTQKQIAELFDVSKSTISEHFANIYENKELKKEATVRNFRTVQIEGERRVNRDQEFYNLDAVISVGYRVNSMQATKFRIWATQILKEYVIKGFVMDDERLKQGNQLFGADYFKELLERIRSIRASERRIYQQITDLFAECSIDYNPKSNITKQFFATVQNKFHYAITGSTAAEIIYHKVDRTKDNMGLTTWKNAPSGRILKSDTLIAKNYLQEKEIKQLERTISAYFDYIEGLVERRQYFTMELLAASVNKFLEFNEYRILEDAGKVSHVNAEKKATEEYEVFNKTQRILSDFDKHLTKLMRKKTQ